MKRIASRPRTPAAQRLYWVWAAMVQRCQNPAATGHKRYGGRGITVCDRWRLSFDAFLADMGIPEPGLCIERRDNDKGNEPDNCYWATRTEQNRNRPTWCRYHNIDGRKLTLKEAWADRTDQRLTYRAFVKRVVTRGWPIEQALSEPARLSHAG